MNVSAAIELLVQLLGAAGKLGAAVAKAHAEGRTTLDAADLAALQAEDDAALAALAGAIAEAKAKGQ